MPHDFDRAAFRTRLVRLRRERFGDDGGAELAHRLGIPARTWANYERGVTMPDVILLRLLCLTGAEAAWLLSGDGAPQPAAAPAATPA